jgi:hypothetical protein
MTPLEAATLEIIGILNEPRDRADAEALMRRNAGQFDVNRLERQLSDLAESMGQPDILARFRQLLE